MASTSETGHAKNVANFETLIAFCTGYGAAYDPSNPALSLLNLQDKYNKAKLKLKAVKDTKGPFDTATGQRQELFKPLKSLATRIINNLVAQQAPDPTIKDARSIIRKLNGKRAANEPIAENAISVSQQSYDRLVDSFEQLIIITQNEPLYTTNEAALKIEALQAYRDQLTTANTNVRTAYVPYSSAIIARDKELYTDDTALLHTVTAVKGYIKATFGATSPEYGQISDIPFKRPGE